MGGLKVRSLACVMVAGAGLVLTGISAAASGVLDPTFGNGGIVTTAVSASTDRAEAVVVQPDGRVVAAGWSNWGYEFALARYNADGSLDTNFGEQGIVTTALGGGAVDVALQPDGKLVAAGWTYVHPENHLALVRYNEDGSLDTTFDGDGVVATSFGGTSQGAEAVVVQADGKLVAAGWTRRVDGTNTDFALARYNPDGSLDASFGVGGKVTTRIGLSANAYALAALPDGRLVVAGATSVGMVDRDFALIRYNTDGSLDPTFGAGGIVTTRFGRYNDYATGVVIQPDGRIVVVGSRATKKRAGPTLYDFALVRYDADGALDTSFDADGRLVIEFGKRSSYGYAVALQPDGRIVAAGGVSAQTGGDIALIRVNPDATLDPSFGANGRVKTSIRTSDGAAAVAIQDDGRIVAAGTTSNDPQADDFALTRYSG